MLWGAAAVALVANACGSGRSQPAGNAGKPMVVAAFYPLAFAVGLVGGEHIRIEDLTGPGVEPHDLELSSDQVRSLADADLVVFLGRGFQPALEDVVSGFDRSRILDALEVGDLRQSEGQEHEGSGFDPHVWLDPTIMAAIVDEVATRLAAIDPDRAATYEANAAGLNSRLIALDEDFSEALDACDSRDIVTSHAAFGHLAARYDLRQVGISGIDPEAEPSPGRLAEIARFVAEHDVSTIFFEELVAPDIAETIAAETGARTAMLSPLESKPAAGDYIDGMEANLVALTRALGCD